MNVKGRVSLRRVWCLVRAPRVLFCETGLRPLLSMPLLPVSSFYDSRSGAALGSARLNWIFCRPSEVGKVLDAVARCACGIVFGQFPTD